MSRRNGQLDRRALFSSAAAAALLAASGLSAAGAPQRGGRLRMALSGASRQDSWTQGDGLFMQVARQGLVFDTLTEVAADGTLRPELATGWRSSADALVWTFDLRPDVSFHDCSALSAKDVAASLRQTLEAEVYSLDETRVEIVLRSADPALPLRLSDPEYIIRPAHALQGDIGTGLYQVTSFTPGQRLLTRRVATHYKDGTAGWFEEVELASIPSENIRAQALAGYMVQAIDVADAGILGSLPDVSVLPDLRKPMQVVSDDIALPSNIGYQRPLDNLRAAERWWFA